FDLPGFVMAHFKLPESKGEDYLSDASSAVADHLQGLWEVLTRNPVRSEDSLITLPHPYIVPGGRFREIYYWDSYFTMLGLQVSGRADLIENMVANFAYLIDTVGYIPNGNRAYYLGRSQPPFFSCMVTLLAELEGDSIMVKYLPQMLKEYQFWMKGREELHERGTSAHRVTLLKGGVVLNHYWDENDTPRPESFREDTELAASAPDNKVLFRHIRAAAESGWDFSSRWFGNGTDFNTIHTTDIIPVDLNCLLCNLEQAISKGYRLQKNMASMRQFADLAEKRKLAIQQYCWSDSLNSFVDFDYKAMKHTGSLSLAMTFPLFFELATQSQADSISSILESQFLKPGGLVTTTLHTGQQWDAPNGWAPLQWVAVKGLVNYGHQKLATGIARRWMRLNEKVYAATGKMMEKYNVEETSLLAGGGEYPAQDGFGWTNGVYLALGNL
ncbi:MAG: trehalase, partial [Bacteroidota bacterium]|nr:trehalase [Bacteroidota bacterium]